MEKALINFSFDDGRLNNYTIAYPILKRFKCPATFNITTGFVKGEFKPGELTYGPPMTMDMVKEVFQDPTIEIAGHGYWHNNSLKDIIEGIVTLKEELGVEKLTSYGNGFASPGTGLNKDTYKKDMEIELEHIDLTYIRLSLRNMSMKRIRSLARKASRILHWPFLYRLAYKDTLMDEHDDKFLYSIPVLSSITVKEIMAIINQAVMEKKACVLMLHSIVEKNAVCDPWDYEVDKFIKLLQELTMLQDKGLLRLTTSMDIFKNLR